MLAHWKSWQRWLFLCNRRWVSYMNFSYRKSKKWKKVACKQLNVRNYIIEPLFCLTKLKNRSEGELITCTLVEDSNIIHSVSICDTPAMCTVLSANDPKWSRHGRDLKKKNPHFLFRLLKSILLCFYKHICIAKSDPVLLAQTLPSLLLFKFFLKPLCMGVFVLILSRSDDCLRCVRILALKRHTVMNTLSEFLWGLYSGLVIVHSFMLSWNVCSITFRWTVGFNIFLYPC